MIVERFKEFGHQVDAISKTNGDFFWIADEGVDIHPLITADHLLEGFHDYLEKHPETETLAICRINVERRLEFAIHGDVALETKDKLSTARGKVEIAGYRPLEIGDTVRLFVQKGSESSDKVFNHLDQSCIEVKVR